MNVVCNKDICPTILSSKCVFYEGDNLLYTGIVTNDSLEIALQKIDGAFAGAGIGYVFENGVTNTGSNIIELGGSLLHNTHITGNYLLQFDGDLISSSFITIGGTSSQFVKGDGSLDSTVYQHSGNYITALTGDGTASGPGSSILTLASVNSNPGTYGSASIVPVITVNSKGLVTNITNTPINYPTQSISIGGDINANGFTGSPITGTLQTVNTNVYGSNTFLKFGVNGKGLVTSAAPITNLDLDGIYGYTPVPNSRTLTINGVTYDLTANRSWLITVGGVAWGLITGTITAQTDLINYLSTNYTPQSRTLTINGVTFDLSTNRSWSVGTITNVTASLPISSSGGTTPNISISQATTLTDGYLSSIDWNTFNNKQPAGNYITTLTGDVTASGPGSVTATISNNAVTYAKIQQVAALSVVGNATNATANAGAISAASNFQILRRSGTSIGFGSIDISQNAVVGSSILNLVNGGIGANLSATGGASQVLRQSTVGGTITVSQLSYSDISGTVPQAWLLASGGTLTGSNTITANTAGWLNFTGTWTATANNQAHATFGGTFTTENTASDNIYGYVFSPNFTCNAGNPATQFASSVYITQPTITNNLTSSSSLLVEGGTTNTRAALKIGATGSAGYFTIYQTSSSNITLDVASSILLVTTNLIGGASFASSTVALGFPSLIGKQIVNGTSLTLSGNFNSPAAGNTSVGVSIGGTFNGQTTSIGKFFSFDQAIINLNGNATNVTLYGIDYNPTLTNVTGLGTHYGLLIRPTAALSGFGTATPTATLQVNGSGSNVTFKTVGAGTTTNYSIRSFQSDGTTEIFNLTDNGLAAFTVPSYTATANNQIGRQFTSTLISRSTASDTITADYLKSTITINAATVNASGAVIDFSPIMIGGLQTSQVFIIPNGSTVAGMTVNTYTNVAPASTSGSGSGALFTITVTSATALTLTAVTTAGSGYAVGDTVTFNGSQFGSGSGSYIAAVTRVTGVSPGVNSSVLRLVMNKYPQLAANGGQSPSNSWLNFESLSGEVVAAFRGWGANNTGGRFISFNLGNAGIQVWGTDGATFNVNIPVAMSSSLSVAGTFTTTALASSLGPTSASTGFVANTSGYFHSGNKTTVANNQFFSSATGLPTISTGIITALGAITGGSGYTNGTYNGVNATGGSGTTARINVTVSGGAVTAVTISGGGINYLSGDSISAAAASIGGTGSGFSVAVSTVDAFTGIIVAGYTYAPSQTSTSSAYSFYGFYGKPTYNLNSQFTGKIAGVWWDPTITSNTGTSYSFVSTHATSLGGLATSSPLSIWDVNGSLGTGIVTSTGSLVLDSTHHTIIITSGTGSYTLPSASSATRRRYVIVNQTGGARTISSYNDKTNTTQTTVGANSALWVQSNGTTWYQIN